MEYLKHAILSIFILTSLSLPAFAQQSLSDAFSASYESENAGNLETAIEVLDSVYDAESYELNLRL
ncbi:hypothetical protein, partial [Rhodohalobacter sp.]|uniref:hypothetical protein n=1 Tax=Rhodohalobacter sp. TaxID=1974210 RepID=UPI00356A49BA